MLQAGGSLAPTPRPGPLIRPPPPPARGPAHPQRDSNPRPSAPQPPAPHLRAAGSNNKRRARRLLKRARPLAAG